MTQDSKLASNKVILHMINSVALEGGGPAEGLRKLAETGVMKMEVACLDEPKTIIASDHPYPVFPLGDSSKRHYGYTPRLAQWLNANLFRFDGVVIHGLWQYHSYGTYRTVLGKLPYLVFPHGMLDPYFKRAYPLKHLRKAAYWMLFEHQVLQHARAVCFTTEAERDCSAGTFWPARWNPAIVSFGTIAPKGDAAFQRNIFFDKYPALRNKRILLFIARLHQKKGCDLLIEAFSRIADDHPDLDLVLAGADSGNLQETLTRQAKVLGVERRIHWTGMLQNDEKWGAFHAAEAFVLPSHQENFGVAVAEALACGIPALISNKVNIWPDIVATEAGIVDDDTVDGTHRSLLRFLALSQAERREMGERGISCFRNKYTMDHTAREICRLFEHNVTEPIPHHLASAAVHGQF